MVRIDQLTNEINRQLAIYSQHTEEEVQALAKKVADEGVARLKELSPADTGSYRKGWRVKKVGKSFVVHNATHSQLTHLLENGHAKAGGGRVPPRVHIRPVEQKMIEEFEAGIKKAVN